MTRKARDYDRGCCSRPCHPTSGTAEVANLGRQMPSRSEYQTSTPDDVLARVLKHAALRPSALAVKDDTTSLTYSELAEQVGRFASGLAALGAAPADRVALYLDNSAGFVVAALGCIFRGAAFVPLNVDSPSARLAHTIQDCSPVLVVCEDGQSPAFAVVPGLTVTTSSVLSAAASPVARSTGARHDAYLIYTSGTTGEPKGVRVSNRAFSWAVGRTVEALGLDATVRGLAVSSFHFDGSYGLVFPVLSAGGTLFVPPRKEMLFLRRFYQSLLDEGITFTSFSPSYLRLLASSRRFGLLARSQLRTIALGGEECVPADIERLLSVLPDVRIFNRYGPTESTIAVTSHLVTSEEVASGRVPLGTPHPGVELFLVGDGGRLIDDYASAGELYIGGEQLMTGYWGDDRLSNAVLRHDVVPGKTLYKTGDLVYRDQRGQYVYLGRLDDVVKRNGVRISLNEVAAAFRCARGATSAHCALTAVNGEPRIVVFVEAAPNVTRAELIDAARGQLAPAMLPDMVYVVGSLPLTSQGKVDRRRLLADHDLSAWVPHDATPRHDR